MDILRFIHSNAIREHLKNISYQFHPLEAALADLAVQRCIDQFANAYHKTMIKEYALMV